MTSIYNNFKKLLFDGSINLNSDTIEVALIDGSGYTPDIDGHVFVGDVLNGSTATECSGSGYSRKTISTPTTSTDLTDDEAVFDGDDLSYIDAEFGDITGILLFKSVTDDTDSPLIAHITADKFPLTTNGGDVNLNWAAEGILNLN